MSPTPRTLRGAALSGLGSAVLYIVHRLLQGLGPDDTTPAGIAAFDTGHRTALAEIPPLSTTLGISLTAAVRWALHAKRDWNAFIQARHEQRSAAPRPAAHRGPVT